MDPFTFFAILVIAAFVSYALAPKIPTPKSQALTDFDVPTADEDREIPVVFGTVTITGPNCIWYGNLRAEQVEIDA